MILPRARVLRFVLALALSTAAPLLTVGGCNSSPPLAPPPPAVGGATFPARNEVHAAAASANVTEETRNAPSAPPPVAAETSATSAPPESRVTAACPSEMVLVEGSYCSTVRQECLRYLDAPGRYGKLRCAEFKSPASCAGERRALRYCIDRDEATDRGDVKPRVQVSWTKAEELCRARDARLCVEDEWQFACEGEEMRPYPYGFIRDATACNIDQTNLGSPEQGLRDLRATINDYSRCVSSFGVHDLTGNADEWTTRAGALAPNRSVLHGGWWLPGRNSCRAATSHHNESYFGPQIGFRCCKDAAAT